MTQIESLPVVPDGVYSWLLDYEVLLFSERAGELFRLNQAAALIWSCLEDGLGRSATVAELAEAFGIPVSQAEQDVAVTLQEWERLELVGRPGEVPAHRAADEPDEPTDLDAIPKPTSPIDDYQGTACYRMLETVIRVRFQNPAMCRIADSVFGHLRISDDHPFDLALDVHQENSGFFLFRNDRLRAHCATEQEVTPLLHGEAVSEAYANTACLLALHAAAVSNGEECIVFPATSGSGKTTLTAALIGAGLKYGTDELVLLQHESHDVQAIAAGLGIKPGSWPVLQSLHPVLERLPTGLRQDGQYVRYLLPEPIVMPEDPAQLYRLRALVFPTYDANAETCLEPVSAAEALCRLTDAGAEIEGGLELGRVTELVEWIRGVRCYALRYGDLREAVSRIAEMLS